MLRSVIVRGGRRNLLAALVLGFLTPIASAQGIGGLGGGGGGGGAGGGIGSLGGGGGGGGAGGSSTSLSSQGSVIGQVQSIGSGNISAFITNSQGLSSLSNTNTGGRGTTTTGAIPAAADPFNTFYTDPYGAGVVSSSTGGGNQTPVFGQPIYPATTPPTATQAPTSTLTPYVASTANGFTSYGVKRAPSYITVVGEGMPLIRHNPGQLQTELQLVIARSSSLSPADTIRIEVLEGGIVRLSGNVSSARDQRLTEGLCRMTPGVQGVVNNLQVGQTVARGN